MAKKKWNIIQRLSIWLNKVMPIYIDIKHCKRVLSPLDKGVTLAIWNCGDCRYHAHLWRTLKGIRITLRKEGKYWKTIKKGAI